VHALVPLQAPDHPTNALPALGDAVSVTALPNAKAAVQVPLTLLPLLHAMPAGADVTVPEPPPAVASASTPVLGEKVAVTVCAALTRTVHGPVPTHPPVPLQPRKMLPAKGVAVRVTAVETVTDVSQLPLCRPLPAPVHAIPAGADATLPAPVPTMLTVSSCVGVRANIAVTVCGASTRTAHVLAVPQPAAPVHPLKVLPVAGVAVSDSVVPVGTGAAQAAPPVAHVIVVEPTLTVPAPSPAKATCTWWLVVVGSASIPVVLSPSHAIIKSVLAASARVARLARDSTCLLLAITRLGGTPSVRGRSGTVRHGTSSSPRVASTPRLWPSNCRQRMVWSRSPSNARRGATDDRSRPVAVFHARRSARQRLSA
jgi:hypothetical protein